jgi:hypothetical protein
MARHVMVVYSDAAAGREDDYNNWYDNEHLADVLSIPGVVGARRFALSGSGGPAKYLALYELDCDDPSAVQASIAEMAGSGRLRLSDAIVPAGAPTFYSQITEV